MFSVRIRRKFQVDKFRELLSGVVELIDFLLRFDSTNPNESKMLRETFYDLIKYFLRSSTSEKDFDSIFSRISVVDGDFLSELVDLIYSMLESCSSNNEKVSLLPLKAEVVEELYSLLTIQSLSIETKILVLKTINLMAESKFLAEESRSRLRLENKSIGFGGVLSALSINEWNPTIIEEILRLVLKIEPTIGLEYLNTVLTFCSAASIDVRFLAVRELMQYFIRRADASFLYSKSLAWQETLAQFFVRKPLNNQAETNDNEKVDRCLPTIDETKPEEDSPSETNFDSENDPTFLVEKRQTTDDKEENLEEMCETLFLLIAMILWKGVTDSDESAWKVRLLRLRLTEHFILRFCSGSRPNVRSAQIFSPKIRIFLSAARNRTTNSRNQFGNVSHRTPS